jgi:transcriptional regulator of acetoin/glycerol metabolism
MRRIAAFSDSGARIRVSDLSVQVVPQEPVSMLREARDPTTVAIRIDRPLPDIFRDVEEAAMELALATTDGRMDLAAKRLGLSRKGLYLKRRRLAGRAENPLASANPALLKAPGMPFGKKSSD